MDLSTRQKSLIVHLLSMYFEPKLAIIIAKSLSGVIGREVEKATTESENPFATQLEFEEFLPQLTQLPEPPLATTQFKGRWFQLCLHGSPTSYEMHDCGFTKDHGLPVYFVVDSSSGKRDVCLFLHEKERFTIKVRLDEIQSMASWFKYYVIDTGL